MTFQRYQSRPITRLAHEIEEDAAIQEIRENTYCTLIDGHGVIFKAYQTPLPGDFIVYLTEEDTYHCAREVFLERNVVEEEDVLGCLA